MFQIDMGWVTSRQILHLLFFYFFFFFKNDLILKIYFIMILFLLQELNIIKNDIEFPSARDHKSTSK
jgi:hypothetical protein